MTIEEALSHAFIKTKCSFLYTTASHVPDEHRFRLVFELEEPITNSNEMEQALTGLVAKVGGDRACTDACRMFFGFDQSTVHFIGKQLTKDDVAELVLFGKELKTALNATPEDKPSARPTLRSQIVIGLDSLLVTDRNETKALRDLPVRTRVHCPVHVDYRASAFVLASKRGVPGIFCATCQATFFSKPFSLRYDFDYGTDRLRTVGVTPWEPDVWNTEAELVGRKSVGPGLYVISERYLPPFNSPCSVVFVKSPKGSGKTEWLRNVVDNAKQAKERILLIGHRTSLIQATAKRLGLKPYFRINLPTDGSDRSKEFGRPTDAYAICADSLASRLDTRSDQYDVIIIDEIEQFLAHLTSSTLKDNRRITLSVLKYFLSKAKQVILLDADLNEVTFSCAPLLIGPRNDCFVLVNEWSKPRGDLRLYQSDSHLLALLSTTVSQGKRCFVCCNSRKRVNAMAALLREQQPDKRILAITGENSQEQEAQAFINQLPASFLQYDVVLVSPAVGTGVDITFANEEKIVDAVFGFFWPHVTTHFDIDQQLSRVRHPGSVHVWVSPAQSHMETDTSVLRAELLDASRRRKSLFPEIIEAIGIDEEGMPQYSPIDKIYAEIYAEVVASQRASKNNLRQHFVDLRRHSGWNVIEVPTEEDAIACGKELLAQGRELARVENCQRVSSARMLSTEDAKQLKEREERDSISHEDLAAVHRFDIEHFYLAEATPALVERDDNGSLRRKVRLFETIHLSEHEVAMRQMSSSEVCTADSYYSVDRRRLLISMFTFAGVFKEGVGFDTTRELTKADLVLFAAECDKPDARARIQRLLELEVARNVCSNPAQQLGRFLGLIGLSLVKSRTERSGSSKIYWYTIDPEEHEEMLQVMSRRQDEKAYESWSVSRNALANPEDPELSADIKNIQDKHRARERQP